MRGSGNDTIFNQTLSDAFVANAWQTTPLVPGTPGDGTVTPPGQVVQPKVLLAHWESDSPGTLDLDYTLGVPVVTNWRDKLNGYTLKAPTLTQAPTWIVETGSMASHRPALAFDGLDDFMETLELGEKLNNLTGISASLLVYAYTPEVNKINRLLWVESGVVGKPRLGYARSGIAPDQYYSDAISQDTDTVTPVTGSVYEYEGWATHTVRRSYLLGSQRVDYNGGMKAQGSNIPTMNYGSSTASQRVRVGAEDSGRNPGSFYLYGLKLYTYALTDDEMLADAAYFGGRISA